MSDSIAFDQAAEYYDKTRALPAEVQARVTDFLAGELRQRSPVLEIGVGTGRMALPLARARVDVVGIDLSEPMVRRLIANAGAAWVVPVALADARHLPFAPGTFGGAFLCHVLHLIPDWQAAVAELVRAVRPGGLLLIDVGGAPTRHGRELFPVFEAAAGAGPLRPGLQDPDELDGVLVGLGCTSRPPVAFVHTIDYTVARILERWESNEHSCTWALSDAARVRAVAEARAWAQERWGDLEAPIREDLSVVWRGFETPAASRR